MQPARKGKQLQQSLRSPFLISALSIAIIIITAHTMCILGAFVLQMLETTLTNKGNQI